MAVKTEHSPDENPDRPRKTVQDLKERLSVLKRENLEQARRFRTSALFLNHCPIGLILLQADRILEINRTALEQMGYREEEVKRRAFWDFMDPASRNALKKRSGERRKGKWVSPQFEVTLTRKNGAPLQCEIRLQRFRHRGRAALLIGLIELEDRSRLLGESAQALKAEARLTMIKGLARQWAPAVSVLSESLRLLKSGNPNNPDSPETPAGRMQTSLARIQTALRALNDLTRIDYDPSELTVFDLKNFMQNLIEKAAPLIQAARDATRGHINFKTFLRARSRIRGHFAELREALLHVLRNALEALPQGGDLFISAEENAGRALIYVQDSGSGIPAEDRTRVLDPFFSTKGPERTGLGLSLAAAIVHRHHGTLELGAPRGQGAVVTINLPLALPETEEKKPGGRQKIKNAAVLLVDRQDLLRPLLAQILTAKGLNVVPADSGRETLTRLKARPFDLVWIGASIPDMAKTDLLPEIKKLRPQTATAVVLDRPDQAENLAADLVLSQPLDMKKAVAQVVELLRKKN